MMTMYIKTCILTHPNTKSEYVYKGVLIRGYTCPTYILHTVTETDMYDCLATCVHAPQVHSTRN